MPRATRSDLWKPLKIGKRTYRGTGKEGQFCLVRRTATAVEFFTITDGESLVGFRDESKARIVAAFFNRSGTHEMLLEDALRTVAVFHDDPNGWTGDDIAAVVEMIQRIRRS